MELRLYDRAGPPLIEPRRWLRLPGWWVRVLEEFERWAGPAREPEADEDPSFAPVALLLGLALAAQYAQLWIPPVRAFLEERSEEHTSELQSRLHLVCRLLLEKKHSQRTSTSTARGGSAARRAAPQVAGP